MKDDVISRQAAIDAMAELQGRASTKAELKGISKAWKQIKQLPSAPERKTGKWEIREDIYGDTEATCSECGFETVVDQPGNNLPMLSDLHFCPSCGAKMEGEADD